MIEAKTQGIIGEKTGYSVTNPGAKDHMSEEIWNRIMYLKPEDIQKVQFWQEIPRRAKYLEIWNEIKVAPVQ